MTQKVAARVSSVAEESFGTGLSYENWRDHELHEILCALVPLWNIRSRVYVDRPDMENLMLLRLCGDVLCTLVFSDVRMLEYIPASLREVTFSEYPMSFRAQVLECHGNEWRVRLGCLEELLQQALHHMRSHKDIFQQHVWKSLEQVFEDAALLTAGLLTQPDVSGQ